MFFWLAKSQGISYDSFNEHRIFYAGMKNIYTLLLLLSFAGSLRAEDWKLIWVTSDYAWHTHQAQGSLTRAGAHLKGTLLDIDEKHVTYELDITLKSESASARFKVSPELDEEFENLSGTYRKLTHAGRLGCIEEIQLINQYEYVGLFREFECKP